MKIQSKYSPGVFFSLVALLLFSMGYTLSTLAAVQLVGEGKNPPTPAGAASSFVADYKGPEKQALIMDNYGKLSLYFIENIGQLDKKIKYYEKSNRHITYFTEDGVTLYLVQNRERESTGRPGSKAADGRLIKLQPLGINNSVQLIAEGIRKGKANYIKGKDPTGWKTSISTYTSVVYKEVYPGIDLKFYGCQRKLEYDIIIRTGGNPSKVKFQYLGVDQLEIGDQGDLHIKLKDGEILTQSKPVIFQEIEGRRVEVEGGFKVINPQSKLPNERVVYGFQVASYDKNYPLFIDPVLSYSTYLGGSSEDFGYAVAVDPAGNGYIAGKTRSLDFPAENALQGDFDSFVTKLNSDGSGFIYTTYLGGSDEDFAQGIAVDSAGNAYVAGETSSTDFPTENGLQPDFAGGENDVFVTKLNSDGSGLIYSTYLGGSANDFGRGIALDSEADSYIVGYTTSSDFPTKNPLQGEYRGGYDVFVAKINTDGSELITSTYLGGGDSEQGLGISVDSVGSSYVTGFTYSTDFPTLNPVQAGNAGMSDVFVSKLSQDGSTLVYSTYLGGSWQDLGRSIAVNQGGSAYVTGETWFEGFPTHNPIQPESGGGQYDAFVSKLSSDGSQLVYSTFLGGTGPDQGNGIAVDGSGNGYVAGFTASEDFPIKDATQNTRPGLGSAFVTKINRDGTELVYSTYLGGGGENSGEAIVVDLSGIAHVAGFTNSTSFPIQDGLQENNAGDYDAFYARLGEAGYLVTGNLWIRAVIDTVEKGPVDAVWKKGGEDTTSRGDRVIWGHFYANPSDVTWGSENNPDLFVKIWFDVSGRIDVNYFHVSVPDIEVYSDYPYDGTADEHGTTTMSRRYIRQYYQGGQSYSDENYEDGNPPSGYSPASNPSGFSTINNLRIGSMINTVEKGPIDAVWRLGGQDTTARGDQVVWGLFYASPSDVAWGSQNNPDLFVKIWFDVSGRVDVNFFHVSVPDIEVYSDLPSDGTYDQEGTTIMENRYIRHEYWR